VSKRIPISLSISRPCGGSTEGCINIQITDELSRIRFAEINVPLAQFSEALTGMWVKAEAEIRNLENVGKTKVGEDRKIECPIQYGKEKQEQWLEQNAQEPGWILNPNLGSQQSVNTVNGKTILRYSVYKFEEQK